MRQPCEMKEVKYRGISSFRIKIPKFSGTLQAEEFIDWLNEVKRVF